MHPVAILAPFLLRIIRCKKTLGKLPERAPPGHPSAMRILVQNRRTAGIAYLAQIGVERQLGE